jgi:uncharacterized protein (DUF1501 family)
MELSRRSFLRFAFSPRGPERDVLVQVFLRGGADGLNLVPPHGERAYYSARPSLALAKPDASKEERSIDLDGFFGLHPALAPLVPAWREKELAVVHAVGSEDETRSHFEAQDLMERGCPVNREMGSGWIARHLRSLPGARPALSAVAISDVLPESLRGSPGASAVSSVDEFALAATPAERAAFAESLRKLYRRDAGELGTAGVQVLETLETVERLRKEGPAERNDGSFPAAMAQVARLVRAEVGLEVACVDLDGWDTHFVQAGGLQGRAEELAKGLATFREQVRGRRVTVVVLTEFGRRVEENVTLGTDHGRGSVMFVTGPAVKGGKVFGKWPGLGPEVLEGPGDLPVTTDYRDVLAEIVAKRLGNERTEAVFPGRKGAAVGVV